MRWFRRLASSAPFDGRPDPGCLVIHPVFLKRSNNLYIPILVDVNPSFSTMFCIVGGLNPLR